MHTQPKSSKAGHRITSRQPARSYQKHDWCSSERPNWTRVNRLKLLCSVCIMKVVDQLVKSDSVQTTIWQWEVWWVWYVERTQLTTVTIWHLICNLTGVRSGQQAWAVCWQHCIWCWVMLASTYYWIIFILSSDIFSVLILYFQTGLTMTKTNHIWFTIIWIWI